MSECCDAPLIGFENGLGRCSECKEMAGAYNEDELDEAILGELDLQKMAQQGAQQAGIAYKGPTAKPLPKRTSQADRDARIAAAPGVPAGTKGTSLDAWKGGKIPANIANNPTYKSEPGKAWIKQQQAAAKKHFGEEQVAEEDVIGDIISKLAQTKAGSKSGKDVIGDIIAKLPKDADDPKTVNMPLPTSKPDAPKKPAVSAQQAQAQANKAVRSMGQDKTTGDPRGILRQSKFSEWSKK